MNLSPLSPQIQKALSVLNLFQNPHKRAVSLPSPWMQKTWYLVSELPKSLDAEGAKSTYLFQNPHKRALSPPKFLDAENLVC